MNITHLSTSWEVLQNSLSKKFWVQQMWILKKSKELVGHLLSLNFNQKQAPNFSVLDPLYNHDTRETDKQSHKYYTEIPHFKNCNRFHKYLELGNENAYLIVILWVYYTIPFGFRSFWYYTIPFSFRSFWHFWASLNNVLNFFIWLRIID